VALQCGVRNSLAALAVGALVVSGACKGAAPASSPGAPATDPRYQAFLTSFADAIVARDYGAAHALVAADARASLSREELEEAFQHYRESLPDQLKATVEVDAYDRDSALLVPDALRGRIDAEGTIHFVPGGDGEGFSAHVWIMQEAGQPRLAHVFVGD
jgi:hypothetical protein